MIQSSKINIVMVMAMILALIATSAILIISNDALESGINKSEISYATQIFGPDIISIEIIADDSDWQEMLDNAAAEQFIMADVVVNGTTFKNVGVRPKGNSSLTQVAQSESDRYSFRLQFNEYIKNQTCFGLESFVVNNMLSDNTYMKEYISYELMKEAGVDAPYFGFADIKVNGEPWGLYLAVELYNDSYEERVFGTTSGMLYNVKSRDMGGDNVPQAPMQTNERVGNWGGGAPGRPEEGNNQLPKERAGEAAIISPDNLSEGVMPPPDDSLMNEGRKGGMGGGGPGGGNSGGSLAYIDDNSSSYSAIFDNVVGKGQERDFERVIEALKALSEGRDIENYFNVDQILRYLAAHTVVVNLDSYSSSMAQNYYIYEKDGQITILPWDYNMAWGGFQSGNALSVINFPIDTPVSGVDMSERPLLEKLFANPEYLEAYHSYLQELIDRYFAEGKFAAKINELDTIINDYVKNDVTAFCTYEEYEQAVSGFIMLGNLRAQSVKGQLDGTVPSTVTAQAAQPEKLISAGDFRLQLLGNMGGNRGENRQASEIPNDLVENENNLTADRDERAFLEDMNLRQQAMQIIQQRGGEITDEVKVKLKERGFTEEQIEEFSVMQNNMPMDNNRIREGNWGSMRVNEKNGSLDFNQATHNNRDFRIIAVLVLLLLSVIFVTARLKRNY